MGSLSHPSNGIGFPEEQRARAERLGQFAVAYARRYRELLGSAPPVSPPFDLYAVPVTAVMILIADDGAFLVYLQNRIGGLVRLHPPGKVYLIDHLGEPLLQDEMERRADAQTPEGVYLLDHLGEPLSYALQAFTHNLISALPPRTDPLRSDLANRLPPGLPLVLLRSGVTEVEYGECRGFTRGC